MFDNIIYDFDGTIADSYPFFTLALMEVLKREGMDDSYESVFSLLKVSVGHALAHYDFKDIKEAKKTMYEIYHEIAEKSEQPIEGAPEILKYAIDNGKRNFLYTHSGKFPTLMLKKWGIYDNFTFIIDSTYDFPRKPAPDAINYLCERFGLDKDKTLMVGDRDIDVAAGVNAKIHGCLLCDGAYYNDYKCEYKINKLCELKKII